MKKIVPLILLVLLFQIGFGQPCTNSIGGVVFIDANNNGVKDVTETTGLSGITVRAFSSSGTLLGTTTTAVDGSYSFPSITSGVIAVMFDVITIPAGYKLTRNGIDGRTDVQFAAAPDCNVDLGLVTAPSGGSLCGANPDVVVARYQPGAATASDILVRFAYNNSGTTPVPGTLNSPGTTLGAIWGLAYQPNGNKLFSAAVMRRHTAFGTGGTGGIYMTDIATNTTSLYVNLNSATFSSLGINLGANPHQNANLLNDVIVGVNNPFDAVGKISFGDIDFSTDGQNLFAVNLNQRTIIKIFTNNPAVPGASITAANVTVFNVPNPGCTGGTYRPWGLKYFNNKLYIGVVCDGSSGGVGAGTNQRAFVYEMDPTTGASTQVLNFPLTYKKGLSNDAQAMPNDGRWNNWISNWTPCSPAPGLFGVIGYAQPILSDIEIDQNGDMIVAFTDRFGMQSATNSPDANGNLAPSATCVLNQFFYGPVQGGDILRAGKCSGSTWTIENNASICGGTPTAGANNGEGPGIPPNNGEFYAGDIFVNHHEIAQGALALIPGKGEILPTIYDPLNFYSNGVRKLNNTTGATVSNYELFTGNNASPFGKVASLGDIEVLCDVNAPLPNQLEIGNRIWLDGDQDGVQDPNEIGLSGVTVQLYKAGVLIATAVTNANGEYYFSSASAGTTTSWLGTGADTAVLANTAYEIRVPTAQSAISGYGLTTQNSTANIGNDQLDSDASIVGANAVISLTTGVAGTTNHTFDFGFVPASLGDKVWRDDDKDGVQDAGEPGVAGITVTLYNSSGAAVGTTVTDTYGNYLFENLQPGNYTVGFTLPSNYQFTLSSGTSETDAANSDVNPVTGRTTTVTLSAGENQRNIDAGIIFSQPSTNSIGDKVWFDSDNDGTQGANETGVSGVTVTLYNNSGNAVATTVTDANGNYIFTNLSDGNYSVGFTLPPGMLFTAKGADNTSGGSGDSNADSDVNSSGINFGKTDIIDLDAAGINSNGVNYTNVDAGLVMQSAAKASLGDRVWNDLDNDGIQDPGEPGVAGVPVTLYASDGTTVIGTTVTDAFGNYIFNNLDAGGYIVGFGTAPGFTRSSNQNTGTDDFADNDANSTTGRTGVYNITAGQRNTSVDAALISSSSNTARLGDYVWFDADKDGVQDGNETPIAGVTVTLYNNSGTAIGATTTDANGYYQFTNLAAGTYSVGFSNLPAGYSFTISSGTTSASVTSNSDADPATGRTVQFTLNAGESLQGLDAGLVAGISSGLGSLGNKVWYDINGDGLQGADELGISNITVTLLDAGTDGILGNADDGPSRTMTTNSLGEYMFTGLPSGKYAVQFGTAGSPLPSGYTTNPNQGIDDALDSDGGTIAGGISTTGVYKLAVGEDNLTVDLGLIPPAGSNSLGNFVWFDLDGDGVQDTGEPGVAGVMVKLYNDGADGIPGNNDDVLLGVTTTDANGNYLFAGLPNDDYYVNFSNYPAGYTATIKSATNNATGSDADRITGYTSEVSLTGNTHDRSVDAGLITTRAALGNFVWLDDDGDGVQDAGETGVAGVTVTLYRPGFGLDGIAGNADDALPVAAMITDQNGKYLFDNLAPGTYEVEFSTLPGGLKFTQQNSPGDNGDNTNSDANPVTRRTSGITLSAGEADLTIDAGLFKPRAVIGNYVWVDTNGDGVQQSTEPAAPGIIVTLLDAGGNPVAIAVTNSAGGYMFPNVAPGTYSVSFSNLPQGSSFTAPNQGGDDNTDSDVIGTTVTGIVVLTTTNNISFDAGIVGLKTLPVKVEFFAVRSGNTSVLRWKVYEDQDIKSYTLERSADGRVFNEMIRFNNDGRSQYDNTDMQPLSGINYYRLKLENINGKIEYSDVKLVKFNSKGVVTVFPNPASEAVNIQLPESWQGQRIKIQVMNQAGQYVLNKIINAASNVETIGIQTLPAGLYSIIISNHAQEKETRKRIVVKR